MRARRPLTRRDSRFAGVLGAPVDRPLLLLLALAGCAPSAERGAPPAGPLTLTNLALAAHALTGAEGLWLVAVREAEQGGADLNGDGDARDRVAFVLELDPLRLSATGLALADDDDARTLWSCDGEAAAFAVSERAQGGLDRNGDGDAEDHVLVVLAGTSVEAHPLAVRALVVGGALVACAVDEAAQGASDLDFDGDADGTALRIFDRRDGAEIALGLRDAVPLAIAAGHVALRLAERDGIDLNGDGDDLDGTVFEIFDGETRLLHNTTLVLAGDAVASAAGTFGVSVSEAGMGLGDLSGDGDADDAVFYVYAPARGFSVNLRLSVPLYPPPAVDGERYLLLARESARARDANADGDRDDWTVQVFEAGPGLLYDTALASPGSAVLLGGWVGIGVSEAMQGSSDLDGDGDADGNILHAYELATGALVPLGIDAHALVASGERLFLLPSEELAALDWNADGDALDRVLFDWNAARGPLRSSGSAAGELLAAQGSTALLLVREGEQGEDANGDGDLDDHVLALHDVERGTRRTIGLAAGSLARLTADLSVLILVDELAQGRDLNGDGDRADEVLHLVRE